MNIKNVLLIGLGCLMGAGITAAIIVPQINNRYEMGVRTGHIKGGNDIIRFLERNINNTQEGKVVKTLEKHLDHKVSRISIIEINGIKTVVIE